MNHNYRMSIALGIFVINVPLAWYLYAVGDYLAAIIVILLGDIGMGVVALRKTP